MSTLIIKSIRVLTFSEFLEFLAGDIASPLQIATVSHNGMGCLMRTEEEEEEEEEGVFKADAVNEEDPERDRETQV